jgi:RND family efflux transporter MFP subunit
VTVRCIPSGREAVTITRTLRGRMAAPPGGDLSVASQVAGRLVEVFVHEGDRIGASAVVATIDDSGTRDALRQADASLVQARSAAANAGATLERTQKLVARGIAAKQELDDAAARADQARAAVSAAVAAADIARRALGRVQVRSSLAGVVTHLWRGPGALVDGTAATPVVQLAATGFAELDADATERQIIDLAPGQAARVELATGGESMPGTVRAVSTSLDPATGLGLVRIAVETPGSPLLGVFGSATVVVGERAGVLVVPSAAMRGAVADGAQVVVCAPAGRAAVRDVQIGWRDDLRVEIVHGLDDGDRVAVDHVLGLQNDSPILEAP